MTGELFPKALLDRHFRNASTIHFLLEAEHGGGVLYVSPNVERLLGVTPDAFLGDPGFWPSRVHPGDLPAVRTKIERMARGQEAVAYEYRFRNGTGEYRWLRDECNPVFDERGALVYFACFCSDISAFKDQANALCRNDEQCRHILEDTNIAIFERDPISLDFIAVSPQIQMLLGVPRSFCLKKGFWLERMLPADRTRIRSFCEKAIAAKQHFCNEYRMLKPDGSLVWLFESARIRLGAHGEPELITGLLMDISARKNSEALLQRQETHFRVVADYTNNWENWFDPTGRLLWVNPAVEHLTGFTPEECMAMADFPRPLVHPDELAKFADLFPEATKGKPGGRESAFIRKDGGVFYGKISWQPIYDTQGTFLGHRSSISDITEQKSLQHRLADASLQLQTILNAAQVGIIHVVERLITWTNPQFARQFGYRPKELLGKSTRMFFSSDAEFEHFGEIAYPVLAKSKPFEMELEMRAKDGHTLGCHLRGMAVDPGDSEKGTIWVIMDVDARRRLERELLELNTNLAQQVVDKSAKALEQERLLVNQARHAAMGEMIGNIAHQWRQPLSVLGLILQNITLDFADGSLDGEALQEYTGKAMWSIQKMSATIDDFRNFFRPNRVMEAFDIAQSIREALNLLDATLTNHNIAVTVRIAEKVQVWGHSNEFAQVILNLLGNAKDALLEHRVATGKIDIEAMRDGDRVVVKVRDNAGGISDEAAEKIFDPYFTTKEKGTGIGLYMTRTIVEQHMKGSIHFHNTGDGAEFVITLPLKGDG